MELIIVLLLVGVVVFFVKTTKPGNVSPNTAKKNDEISPAVLTVPHRKKEHLTTINERKLYFALQKAIDSKYIVHSQVSLIALVEPLSFKDNSKSWAKRMDFVITDKATKILAVIELDDSSHSSEKRKKRDAYVNNALKGHHPLIRLPTKKFYEPQEIAGVLEREAGIPSVYSSQDKSHNKQCNSDSGATASTTPR